MESGTRIITGPVLARDVSLETFMAEYAHLHAEWVDGVVIKMSPVSRKHDLLVQFLAHLLRIYLSRSGVGKLMLAPFVMRARDNLPAREPDLHVVVAARADIIQETMTAGPADVVVEIISPESNARDRGEKFDEYQSGGVREYWLIDPLREEALFYRLAPDGVYYPMTLSEGTFHSAVLERFNLTITDLWDATLWEDDARIRALVDAMLA